METQEPAATVAMTDLAEDLQGPQGPEVAARIAARLDALKGGVEDRIRSGLPLGQVEEFQKISRSLDAARSIVIGLVPR